MIKKGLILGGLIIIVTMIFVGCTKKIDAKKVCKEQLEEFMSTHENKEEIGTADQVVEYLKGNDAKNYLSDFCIQTLETEKTDIGNALNPYFFIGVNGDAEPIYKWDTEYEVSEVLYNKEYEKYYITLSCGSGGYYLLFIEENKTMKIDEIIQF